MHRQSQVVVAGEGHQAMLPVTVVSCCDSEACRGIHRLTAQSCSQPVMTGTHFHLVLDQNPQSNHLLSSSLCTLHAPVTWSPFPPNTSVMVFMA